MGTLMTNNKILKKALTSMIPIDGRFGEEESKFLKATNSLHLEKKEISVENLWLGSKDIEVVNFYMQIVNAEVQTILDQEHSIRE